jgi:2-polyprenyl-3-methyl-5-hydroxy-6-metoxy-1,4-benzoquinol methylase
MPELKMNMQKLYIWMPWLYPRTRFVSQLKKRGKMLDVGVGPGEFKSILSPFRSGWSFDGTDIEKHSNLSKTVHFFKSDINRKINCPSDTYDAVVCTHVFEHLERTDVAIKEIARVLKPDGVLYLETPSQRSVHLPSFTIVNSREPVPINFYDDHTHIRPYSPPSLVRIAESAGLEVVRVGYARNWVATLTSPITFILAFVLRKRSYLVHSVWHTVGWASYIVARKPS